MNQEKSHEVSKLGIGKILIAEPFMDDEFFKKSVVLLTDYHEEGTIGFVLNKPIRLNIKKLVSDFPNFGGSVHLGGPVQKEMIHYIHTAGDVLDGSIEIMPGVFWGGDFNQLKFLISNGVINEHDIRFFVGYSGWSPGQLEEEMDESKSWLVLDGDPNYVFYPEHTDLWNQALSHRGKYLPLIASTNEAFNFN